MTRFRAFVLVLLVLAVSAWPVWRAVRPGGSSRGSAHAEEPPTVVSDSVVQVQPWQSRLQAYGQVRAVQGADLSAEVPGIVDEIDFNSGDEVKAGTVLLRLRLYDDAAKLQQLQAMVALWTANLQRDQKQFEAQAISRATLDLDTANLRNFQAQVAAQVQAMDEKIVRAPFSGKLGIRQVDLGQYLNPGTAVVTLQALDPIYVDFNVVQQQTAFLRIGQPVQVSVDAYTNRSFEARVIAIDSRIDPQNRMVSVRAALDNKDHALLPGMFAVAHLDVGTRHDVIAVPQGAISFNPYGDFVYLLTPKQGPKQGPGDVLVATSRVVKLGETKGDRVVVLNGLAAGDRIVTAGGFKLRSGAPVVVDNRVQPPDSMDPAVAEE